MVHRYANKYVPMGIVQTCSCFDRKFSYWLCMGIGMGMKNLRLFQLGMEMYIYPHH